MHANFQLSNSKALTGINWSHPKMKPLVLKATFANNMLPIVVIFTALLAFNGASGAAVNTTEVAPAGIDAKITKMSDLFGQLAERGFINLMHSGTFNSVLKEETLTEVGRAIREAITHKGKKAIMDARQHVQEWIEWNNRQIDYIINKKFGDAVDRIISRIETNLGISS